MPPSLRLFVVPALAVALLVGAALPAQADPAKAEVVIVHAVPGLTVDVYVDGSLALPSFEPGTITPALPFDPGTYAIAIVGAGGDPLTPVISGSATVAGGDRVTLVAHLAADGTPTLGAFVDDLSLADRGEGRLIVRHVAAAPAVDVELSRRLWRWSFHVGVLENLANGGQTQLDARPGRYQAELFAAGTSTSAFGPAGVRVRPGEATVVYALGDLGGGSFDLLVERRDLRASTANVTVVHGILGLAVDVYVDGSLALPAFQPRTITDVIELPCGEHDVAIRLEGAPASSAPVLAATVDLAAGSDTSLVAHLAADGSPTLSAFANDLSNAGYGSRVVVRHTAAAPEVDTYLQRRIRWFTWTAVRLTDLANGEQAAGVVWSGRYAASVNLAGTDTRVLGPATLKIRPRTVTFVYAIGSAADENLDLLTQTRNLR